MRALAAMPLGDLGWVDQPGSRCLGFFVVDPALPPTETLELSSPSPSSWDGEAWVFEHPLTLQYQGSQLESQAGRWWVARKEWTLEGQSRLLRAPVRLLAEKGSYRPVDQAADLETVVFRVGPTAEYPVAMWGEAREAHWRGDHTRLQGVHLSICSPRRSLWGLRAREAVFKHTEQQMSMRHVVAYFLGIPVFYLPWLDLDLLRDRESGFLSPQLYLNRGAVFATVPLYWAMAPYADMTLSPLLSVQDQWGALAQMRYLSPWGYTELGGVALRDGDSTRYRLSSQLQWAGKGGSLEMLGYQVSDGSFVEDYPRFSQNIPWLIPWSARVRLHGSYTGFEAGFDSFQDFSPSQDAALFGYYRRLPWIRFVNAYPWHDVLWHSVSKYVHALPTASYVDVLPGAPWVAQHLGGRYVYANDLGLWDVFVDQVWVKVEQEGQPFASSLRSMLKWQTESRYLGIEWQPKLAFLAASLPSARGLPWLNARPIPLMYDRLFEIDRFTEETVLSDARDFDWALEGRYRHWLFGCGGRYALRAHEMTIAGVEVYDPLLTAHASPILGFLRYQSGPWRLQSMVNWGGGDFFQYQNQATYEDGRARLGVYGVRLPVDYPAYTTVDSVVPTQGLGVLWGIGVSERWQFEGEWYTQMDQTQSGYQLAMRYRDCCLQMGWGVKRSFLPIESQSDARTQWFAELNFDTSTGMIDTVAGS